MKKITFIKSLSGLYRYGILVLLLGMAALIYTAYTYAAPQGGIGVSGLGCSANCTFTGTTTVATLNASGVISSPSVQAQQYINVLASAAQYGTSGAQPIELLTNSTVWLTISTTGQLDSARACIAGYTRMTPNYCANTTDLFNNSWADTVACTAYTPYDTLPTTATDVDLMLEWYSLSNNAIGLRGNAISFFREAGCTNQATLSSFKHYEAAAVAAGTIIHVGGVHVMHVPLVNEAGVMKFRATQSNAGGNGNANINTYGILGYYD